MKKNAFATYVKERITEVEKALEEYRGNQSPVALHHLRIQIKKIKAIISFSNGPQGMQKIRKLRPLFRKAGSIREIEVNAELLDQLSQVPQQLIDRLKKIQRKRIEQFLQR